QRDRSRRADRGGRCVRVVRVPLQPVFDGRREASPVGLNGRDRVGRLHHLAHLPDRRPLADLLGDLGDRGVGDVGQFGVGEGGRQVFVDNARFGVLVGGQLAAAVL